jgi:hypothetical protein
VGILIAIVTSTPILELVQAHRVVAAVDDRALKSQRDSAFQEIVSLRVAVRLLAQMASIS